MERGGPPLLAPGGNEIRQETPRLLPLPSLWRIQQRSMVSTLAPAPQFRRGRSRSRCPGKKVTCADMVRDSGYASTTPTSSKQGNVQPEHVADPRMHTQGRENKALKQELADLKATLARLEGRVLRETPLPIPQSSESGVASSSPNKSRVVIIQTDDDTFDVNDFMSDISQAPFNASACEIKAKKHRKTKSKFTKFYSAIADIKEALLRICGRLDRLDRPIAKPRAMPDSASDESRQTLTPYAESMSSPGPQPVLPTPPQQQGLIGEVNTQRVMLRQHHGYHTTIFQDLTMTL
ncbi:hypothetical protein HPB51_000693 [Rhipicephalus microplus]|uniref:Uncharacterized protein n=1 Tax=Rhipicephalus microplus TaxID=6941 RepID=A0A9J6DS99_RHIMP|nr:hypothetical protein HPB51_000693 [Rhipicephalus microplus]